MSDFRAIGGVSSTLRTLLLDRMKLPESLDIDKFSVTIGPPAMQPKDDHTIEPPRINLFLYQIIEDPFLKNQEIPRTGCGGAFISPPLSLNLHYMLTAYGSESEKSWVNQSLAHHLLGSAMRVLFDHPVITGDMRTTREITGSPILAKSLQNQREMLKVTLFPLGLEDSMKIWTALMAPCRPSVFYLVNLVQIESERPRSFPSLVGEPPHGGPRITAAAFRMPRIDELRVRRSDDPRGTEFRLPYARIEDTLLLLGSGFSEPCRITAGDVQIQPGRIREDLIEILLPDIPALNPGPRSIVFQGLVAIDKKESLRPAMQSNEAVFMLVPHLRSAAFEREQRPRSLSLTGTRLYAGGQQNLILIGNVPVPEWDIITRSSTEVNLALPEGLPNWPASCLVSGHLSEPLAGFYAGSRISISIGGEGAVQVELPLSPKSILDAATLLQSAIRRSSSSETNPTLSGFRVGFSGDQLILLPGRAGEVPIEVSDAGGGAAQALGLLPELGASLRMAYLSGDLERFPSLTSRRPGFRMTIAGISRDIFLDSVPASAPESVLLLARAINSAGPEAAFRGTTVSLIGGQMLILPGVSGSVIFGPVQGVDETTVSELRLSARYRIRVRVNGAESIDTIEIELP